MNTRSDMLARAGAVIVSAQQALESMKSDLGEDFLRCCDLLVACKGKVLTTGVGKSGLVARKFAATLAGLGRSAFFIHPCELSHGDAGNIGASDVVVMFSNSGQTAMLMESLPLLRQRSQAVIAVVGRAHAYLSSHCDCVVKTGYFSEGCFLGLAPTTSTTAAFVLADALAVVVSEQRDFTQAEYAQIHPDGRLGALANKIVKDCMLPIVRCVVVDRLESVLDSLLRMASAALPFAVVIDRATKSFLGVQTVAMLRQAVAVHHDVAHVRNADYLQPVLHTIRPELPLVEAERHLHIHKLEYAVVLDDKQQFCGVLSAKDLGCVIT